MEIEKVLFKGRQESGQAERERKIAQSALRFFTLPAAPVSADAQEAPQLALAKPAAGSV